MAERLEKRVVKIYISSEEASIGYYKLAKDIETTFSVLRKMTM